MGIIIPAIAGWLNGKRQRRHLREYMRSIYEVNNNNHAQDTAGYLGQLKEIRSDIEKVSANGNISGSQYDILNTKISEHSDQNNNRFTGLPDRKSLGIVSTPDDPVSSLRSGSWEKLVRVVKALEII